jgi:hypothetical protein
VNASKNGSHRDLTESSPRPKAGFFSSQTLIYVCSWWKVQCAVYLQVVNYRVCILYFQICVVL